MVLAETEEVDVLHDHHLVVVLDEHGVVQDFLHVLVVARGEIPQGVRHALGRLLEPLALRVLTELLQELRDQLFEHHAPPRYSNRFFAVSTTLTRRSRASPTAGSPTIRFSSPRSITMPVCESIGPRIVTSSV